MTAPTSDEAAIRQTLRALKSADHAPLYVDFGDGDTESVESATEEATLAAIRAVDDAFLAVRLPDGSEGWIRFVMGNDPEEVICDHTVNLSPVLDPLTEGWWA